MAVSQTRLVVAILVAAACLAGALAAVALLGSRSESSKPASTVPASELFAGIPQHGTVLGKSSAPVTLVEFADVQCPYCALWSRDTLPTAVNDYVRTGRLKLDFNGMAFVGPDSERALRAVLAAGRQDKLWPMLHALYAVQGTENTGWVTDQVIRDSAASAGADVQRLLADMPKVDAELKQAEGRARVNGITATPTFALVQPDGSLLGLELPALDPDTFRATIEQYLA